MQRMLTRKAVGSAVVQSAVTALRVHGGFYDILGLAVVFLRELCDGGPEVVNFVDAGEVEDVVDLVGCESECVCGRHDWCVCVWVYTERYSKSTSFLSIFACMGSFAGPASPFFLSRGLLADRSGR